MMYMQCCTYTESSNPHKYHFTGNCVMCGKPKTVIVDAEELYKYNKGLIEQISNNDDEREFLISGICPECWNETFKDDEVDPLDVESRLTEIKDDLSVEWPEHPMAEDAMEECDGCGLFMFECECDEDEK